MSKPTSRAPQRNAPQYPHRPVTSWPPDEPTVNPNDPDYTTADCLGPVIVPTGPMENPSGIDHPVRDGAGMEIAGTPRVPKYGKRTRNGRIPIPLDDSK